MNTNFISKYNISKFRQRFNVDQAYEALPVLML